MNHQETIRKVQWRQGSFVVTLPKKLADTMGIRQDSYVRITATDGRIILDLVPADCNRDGYEEPEYAEDMLQNEMHADGQEDDSARLDTLRM